MAQQHNTHTRHDLQRWPSLDHCRLCVSAPAEFEFKIVIKKTFFSLIYSVLMVISSVCNFTVLKFLIERRVKSPSRIDAMLIHLALADLLVTFLMMPMEIGWAFTVQWLAGDLMCRLMSFFRTFGLYLSSFVLVCISMDRCEKLQFCFLLNTSIKTHLGKVDFLLLHNR